MTIGVQYKRYLGKIYIKKEKNNNSKLMLVNNLIIDQNKQRVKRVYLNVMYLTTSDHTRVRFIICFGKYSNSICYNQLRIKVLLTICSIHSYCNKIIFVVNSEKCSVRKQNANRIVLV